MRKTITIAPEDDTISHAISRGRQVNTDAAMSCDDASNHQMTVTGDPCQIIFISQHRYIM